MSVNVAGQQHAADGGVRSCVIRHGREHGPGANQTRIRTGCDQGVICSQRGQERSIVVGFLLTIAQALVIIHHIFLASSSDEVPCVKNAKPRTDFWKYHQHLL